MDRKIRVGIIGTGNISHSHMAGYKALPDQVEIAAICDINRERVDAYGEKYGVAARYTDYKEMLKNEPLDAVSVTTWNSEHGNAAIAALEAGVNVLCEKPMALNAQIAEEMAATAKRCGKLLMIGFVRRFGNDAAVLKDFVDAGRMGDIYYAKATYLRRNGCPGGWFGDKEYSGGGPLIDLGVHVMDLVRYLAGSPKPISAYGVTYNNLGMNRTPKDSVGYSASDAGSNRFKFNVEDMVSAIIRFDNGLSMIMEASFNLNLKSDVGRVELFGTKAGARLDPGVELYTELDGYMVDVTPHKDTALSFTGLFENEIAHFVDCVKNGTPCRSTAEDGIAVMKMIDAIYESARTGHEAQIVW